MFGQSQATEELIHTDGKLITLVNNFGSAQAYLPHVRSGQWKLRKDVGET